MIRAVLVDQSNNIIQAIQLDDAWQTPGQPTYYQPPDGLTVIVAPNAGIGWTYDGKTFTAPLPNPTPAPITPITGPVTKLIQQLQSQGTLTAQQVATLAIPITT